MEALTLALGRLSPMSVEELLLLPDLQTRFDRKYLVTLDVAQRLIGEIDGLRCLVIDGEPRSTYDSLYFDTPERQLYRDSATARRRRFKVRLRTYRSDGRRLMEVKTSGVRGETIKHRLSLEPDGAADPYSLLAHDEVRAFIDEAAGTLVAHRLAPVVTTTYERSTLTVGDAGRATIDTDLRCRPIDGIERRVTGHLVVETKTSGTASPIDRYLWSRSIRPLRVSKFGISMALTDPKLGANRWNRVINAYCRAPADAEIVAAERP